MPRPHRPTRPLLTRPDHPQPQTPHPINSPATLNPKPVHGDEPPPTGTPTALYRLSSYDADLLYVGITDNPDRRLREHAKTQSWWHQVEPRLTQLEWFASRP